MTCCLGHASWRFRRRENLTFLHGAMNQTNEQGMTYIEKVRIFSHDYLRCCEYIIESQGARHFFTKKLYSKLIGTTQLMEDFLDFHGAKNNNDWYYYRELTAAVRHFSLGAYTQKHIANRLIYYDLPDSEQFETEGERTLDFLNDCLCKLAPVIIAEADRLDIPAPGKGFDPTKFPSITSMDLLDYDIGPYADCNKASFFFSKICNKSTILSKFIQPT